MIGYIVYNYFAIKQSNDATEQIVQQELQLLIIDYEQAQSIDLRIAALEAMCFLGEKSIKRYFRIMLQRN